MTRELSALAAADFQWTTHIDSVWHELPFHVPAFQGAALTELSDKLARLGRSREAASPLGVPILGPAGAGKTHLLNSLRKEAYAQGLFFVLIDMTDVSNFDETLLLGTLRSLSQPHVDGRSQGLNLLDALIREYGDSALQSEGVAGLAAARSPQLITRGERLIGAVRRRHPGPGREHQDVLRALILLCSDDLELVDVGDGWLQSIGISAEDATRHGFQKQQQKPGLTYRGLSWLMSLTRPTVLALDQLDAIVAEHNLASSREATSELSERQSSSLAIIQGLAGGLLALRDTSYRTMIVVSCLEVTWSILDGRSTVSMQDRYEPPVLLRPLTDPGLLEKVVELRLRAAYRDADFSPPYPCFPFRGGFFSELTGASPRELLKRCDAHRRECLRRGVVIETGSTQTAVQDDFGSIRHRFGELMVQAPVSRLLSDEDEVTLDSLVESACLALAEVENPVPSDVDAAVDLRFPGRGAYESLAARIRLVFHAEQDRERHYALRFLQKSNPNAFQARLKAAITASGIETDVPFRRLAILRVGATPNGGASDKLVEELRTRGGLVIEPSRDELAALWAVHELRQDPKHSHLLPAWLANERVVSRLSIFSDVVQWLYGDKPAENPIVTEGTSVPPTPGEALSPSLRETPPITIRRDVPPASGKRKMTVPGIGKVDASPSSVRKPPASRPSAAPASRRPAPEAAPASRRQQPEVAPSSRRMSPAQPPPSRVTPAREPKLPLGERIVGGSAKETLELPLAALRKHTSVLAGASSGKTTLLERIVQESVLLGVPAIVVDTDSDLSMLGAPWPSAPDGWRAGDAEKARRYHEQSEVVIWTPGISRGNPLAFNPIPDLAAVADDADELIAALGMVVSSLAPIVVSNAGRGGQAALGVLMGAVQHFARIGGGNLSDLIQLLRDLPPAAYEGFERGDQTARKMSELLLAESKTNPLLAESAPRLDPESLLSASQPGKTRVSVINLRGLHAEALRQQFVGQLCMTLFSFVRKHPLGDRPLLGLLVIDEARDFAPSGKAVPGKDNLIRLIAQARKYGLGIVFATQAPTSLDPRVIADCATQFCGRTSAPAGIQTVQEQLRQRGGSGGDLATLAPGVFYVHTEGMPAPARLATRLSLSAHPSSPPDEAAIVQRAEQSRRRARVARDHVA